LAAYPQLSAVRVLDEIRAAGYTGGYTQLKDFVRLVRPALPPAPVIRFETPPGRQAQVDFARFRFPWGVRYALLVVLGYSRLLWCRFYARQDMRTLIGGLEEAFDSFGGVPQELIFDQMKAVDLGWRSTEPTASRWWALLVSSATHRRRGRRGRLRCTRRDTAGV
jgi:transposase